MPPAAQTSPVPTTGDDPQLLYRAIPQVDVPPGLQLECVLVTPEMAKQWLAKSDAHEDFRNRPTRVGDVRRWKLLMETGRFVSYLPDGPILMSAGGCLLNGKHRLTALCGHNQPIGLVIIKNVPDWMMNFFDTGRNRSLRDLFEITGHMTPTQVGSTARQAMRYEEFIHGKRSAIGWRFWAAHRDEHTDVVDFVNRRSALTDLYGSAELVYRGSKLLIASAMTFRLYQELAWPEGAPFVREFFEGIAKGAMLAAGTPALTLREWSKDIAVNRERVPAKREAHLLLLLRFFALTAQKEQVHRVQYGYGQPMLLPYHPDGDDAALANLREGLAALDAEHETSKGQAPAKTGRKAAAAKKTAVKKAVPPVRWAAAVTG